MINSASIIITDATVPKITIGAIITAITTKSAAIAAVINRRNLKNSAIDGNVHFYSAYYLFSCCFKTDYR